MGYIILVSYTEVPKSALPDRLNDPNKSIY